MAIGMKAQAPGWSAITWLIEDFGAPFPMFTPDAQCERPSTKRIVRR
jgi:hypothetical protein